MLKLYFAKGTAALAPHILLEEAGAEYEAQLLDLARGDQRDSAFLAVNPKGRVPALETEEGVLTETPAILTYVAERFPAANLLPTDAFDRARAHEINAYFCATVHVAHAHKHRGHRWSDDEAAWETMRVKVAGNMTDCARVIERHYLAGPWVLGDAYSICDPYLFVITRWMGVDGVTLEDFPALSDHFRRMQERPSVRKVFPLHG